MKKSSRKLLACVVTLILLMSTMSMTVTAAEEADVDPCAVVCPHSHYTVTDYHTVSQYNGAYHRVTPYRIYTCSVCGYSYTTAYGSPFYEAHTSTPCGICGYSGS